MPSMGADTLELAIQNITEGCVGCRRPSQHMMYFIYKMHEKDVPLLGTRFETYKFVKAVAGSKVEKPNNQCHEYALSHRTSMAWFFTDNMFE